MLNAHILWPLHEELIMVYRLEIHQYVGLAAIWPVSIALNHKTIVEPYTYGFTQSQSFEIEVNHK